MELKIYSPTADGFVKEITWNHEEIKKEVAEKVQYYKNLVYTDDQIKEAKADRAQLNKFVQALDGKRKEIKKQCLAPYEDFEKKLKEITAIVNEPIQMIDQQVKGYEEKKRQEKLDAIKEYFETCEKPFEVKLEMILDQKWLNSSVSMKTVKATVDSIIESFREGLSALQNLPEFSFEAIEVYKSTLDLNKAINEGHRLADIQKRKAEYEAKKKAEESGEIEVHITPPEPDDIPGQMNITDYQETIPEPKQVARQWIGFKAFLTVDDAKALADFFKARNIEFSQVKID